MKLVAQNDNAVTIELAIGELRLLFGALHELHDGASQLDNKDWDAFMGAPRKAASTLLDELLPILEKANEN